MSHSHNAARSRYKAASSASRRSGHGGQNARAVWSGFFVSVIGYLILSAKQPLGWGQMLWEFLAFVIIPALSGVVVNRLQLRGRPQREAFFSGAKAVGWGMFIYTSITLIVLGNRLGRPDGGGQEVLAGLLTAVVFTGIAGTIGGMTNVALIRMTGKRS